MVSLKLQLNASCCWCTNVSWFRIFPPIYILFVNLNPINNLIGIFNINILTLNH